MRECQGELTFYLWGDTHFGYAQRFGQDDLRWDIVSQMNDLAGWPYPEEIGGCVETPSFVMHCGDMVDGDWESGEYELAAYRHFSSRLRIPHYETLGNHDTDKAFTSYFRGRYKGSSHSFDLSGVHFISLCGRYDAHEVGSVPSAQMGFLERDIAALPADMPIVLFSHSRLDRLKNGRDVARMLSRRRTILVASAHLHRPAVFTAHGIPGLDIGHCRNHPIDPEWGRSFTVVRIKGGSLSAIPWRWDLKDWERGQRQFKKPDIRRFAIVNRHF